MKKVRDFFNFSLMLILPAILTSLIFSSTVNATGMVIENNSNHDLKILISSFDSLCGETTDKIMKKTTKKYDYGLCRMYSIHITPLGDDRVKCTSPGGSSPYSNQGIAFVWGYGIPQHSTDWGKITCNER